MPQFQTFQTQGWPLLSLSLDPRESGTVSEWLLPTLLLCLLLESPLSCHEADLFPLRGWVACGSRCPSPLSTRQTHSSQPALLGTHASGRGCWARGRGPRGWVCSRSRGAQLRPLLGLSAWGSRLKLLTLMLIAVNQGRVLWCDWR